MNRRNAFMCSVFFVLVGFMPATANALAIGAELVKPRTPSLICRTVARGDNPWDLVRKMSGIRDRGIIARAVPAFYAQNPTAVKRLWPGDKVCFTLPDSLNPAKRADASIVAPSNVARMAWPIPVARARVTDYFDPARVGHPHPAIDIAAPLGTPITASLDGRVAYIGHGGNAGNYIEVRYTNGVSHLYCHLATVRVTAIGQRVKAGMRLGTVGMTGNASGPHVHLVAMRDGREINPLDVFVARPMPRLATKVAARLATLHASADVASYPLTLAAIDAPPVTAHTP